MTVSANSRSFRFMGDPFLLIIVLIAIVVVIVAGVT
jgi:hypothetical protein